MAACKKNKLKTIWKCNSLTEQKNTSIFGVFFVFYIELYT